jgi:hypothetical protein
LCNERDPACEGFVEYEDEYTGRTLYEHGPDCPLDKLNDAFARHPVLRRAIDLDFAASLKLLSLDDIDVEEFEVMKILRSERDKYQTEQMPKPNTPSR